MLTVLVDYDSGNLHSAEKAFQRMALEVDGGDILVSAHPEDVARADRIVLPGDGAFPACRNALMQDRAALYQAIVEAVTQDAKPFFGICVGMQMMASMGHEYSETPGLGLKAAIMLISCTVISLMLRPLHSALPMLTTVVRSLPWWHATQ